MVELTAREEAEYAAASKRIRAWLRARLILRHHQENNKAFAIGDTIGSGLHVWMIVRNAGIQTRK